MSPDGNAGGAEPPADPFESLPDADAESDPFERLDRDPDERSPEDGLFDEVSTDAAPEEELDWAELLGDETTESDPEGALEPVSNEATVPKQTHCEGCEFFATPPVVGCEYPEGELVEVVDMAHFRVRNCPVVERRREGEEYPVVSGED